MKRLIVTIDGPAGAGKTTVSRMLADRLGYKYIDTGALYRAVAYEAISAKVASNDDNGLDKLCRTLKIQFVPGRQGLRLFSGTKDISDRIRTSEISMFASAASARPVVRAYLLDLQRELGREKGAVFEGRDMGTVVFPNADIKFYLDASPETRALRRYRELAAVTSQTFEEVQRDLKQRDTNDSTRDLAPLKPAEDAVIVDSTDLSIQAVVEFMLSAIENRFGPNL